VFSRRVPSDLKPNALTTLRAELGAIPYDLTVSNPTQCRILYPESMLSGLGSPDGLVYRPDPLGLASAREAIAATYAEGGVTVDPARIVLTASTSEAYSMLFKLLCDPGDQVLIPSPSYPLFEHLALLDGVAAAAYPLDPRGGWQPDLAHAAAERPRAVVAVHPNNPTGTFVHPEPRTALIEYCSAHGAALVVDEVFHGYAIPRSKTQPTFAGTQEVLTFTLNGLSKCAGLPQAKLAWIVVSGPETESRAALERLAFVADNYLSVGTSVQLALDGLLGAGSFVRSEIRKRCGVNLTALSRALLEAPEVSWVAPEGGWSAVVRFPNVVGEEELALELLREDGVAVHPGYFFDFPEEGYLALSLLPPPDIFAEGLRRVFARVGRKLHA